MLLPILSTYSDTYASIGTTLVHGIFLFFAQYQVCFEPFCPK